MQLTYSYGNDMEKVGLKLCICLDFILSDYGCSVAIGFPATPKYSYFLYRHTKVSQILESRKKSQKIFLNT